ncbi:uncharacterized protein DUF3955 [Sinobacterium caligoides]|uniref:Uncharacterized protein DUF3955 n=1 Tax=Sinobacterium caligoides TaxID=933926 RepID=A0A3N2DKN3_9GAMM|nr:DUF3955 domain-containing protein [Sinobacterium caligoides]ROS00363.1 uncharacterized protein DUF3955 [Sinobacterium caligoides]
MNNKSIGGTLYISLLLVGMGVLFICFEEIFYQRIDDNGVLHESLFLPLGAGTFTIGFVLLVVSIAIKLIKRKKKP